MYVCVFFSVWKLILVQLIFLYVVIDILGIFFREKITCSILKSAWIVFLLQQAQNKLSYPSQVFRASQFHWSAIYLTNVFLQKERKKEKNKSSLIGEDVNIQNKSILPYIIT